MGYLHIHSVILVPLHILKGFESRVCSNNKLVLGLVQFGRCYRHGLTVAKMVVEYFVKGAVRLNLGNKLIHLFKQFRLVFVYAKSIFLLCQRDVNDLDP